METIRLTRTGQPPLEFEGETLAEIPGRLHDNQALRWHDVAVHRTAAGQLVVEIAYRTQWRGENGHAQAEPVNDQAAVARVLQAYDPTAHVGGFPNRPEYADRQRNLLGYIAARYQSQVTAILEELGISERID